MTNRTISLPEGGKGAHLAFDVAAMEALHDKYGDGYVNEVLAGLDRHDISVFLPVLDVMVKDSKKTPAEIVEASAMADLAIMIADAISLRIYGRTFKEQQEHNFASVVQSAETARDVAKAIETGTMIRNEARDALDKDAA